MGLYQRYTEFFAVFFLIAMEVITAVNGTAGMFAMRVSGLGL